MSNGQLEEQMDRENDQKVASFLGITYEEYISLEPSVEEMAGDDDLIYGYLVSFDAPIPVDIAARIRGLDGDEVTLPPAFFDEDKGDQEWPQG